MLVAIGLVFPWTRSMARRRIDLLVGEYPPHGAARSSPVQAAKRSQAEASVSAIAPSTDGSPPNRLTGPVAGVALRQADLRIQPDCRRCVHFAVSWEPTMPYLCRGFGFKSRTLPSWEVQQADGHPCRLFAARP
jgi:hypothetical protein